MARVSGPFLLSGELPLSHVRLAEHICVFRPRMGVGLFVNGFINLNTTHNQVGFMKVAIVAIHVVNFPSGVESPRRHG